MICENYHLKPVMHLDLEGCIVPWGMRTCRNKKHRHARRLKTACTWLLPSSTLECFSKGLEPGQSCYLHKRYKLFHPVNINISDQCVYDGKKHDNPNILAKTACSVTKDPLHLEQQKPYTSNTISNITHRGHREAVSKIIRSQKLKTERRKRSH